MQVGNKTRGNITHCVCMPGMDEEGDDIDPTATPPSELTAPPTPASSSGGSAPAGPVRKRRFVRKKVSKMSLASMYLAICTILSLSFYLWCITTNSKHSGQTSTLARQNVSQR